MPTATAAVPARLAPRPVQGGMVIPWIAVQLSDGTYDLAACHGLRVSQAMLDQLCQICGDPISPPVVFFASADQLADMLFDAPPMHPECAAYSARVCPMVSGRLSAYRAKPSRATTSHLGCVTPGCDCGGWTASGPDRGVTAAPPWFAVWCRSYERVAESPEQVQRIRRGLATPGQQIWAHVPHPTKIRLIARST